MPSSAPDAGRDSEVGRQIRVVVNAVALDITEGVIEVCRADESPPELAEKLRVAIRNANRETAKS